MEKTIKKMVKTGYGLGLLSIAEAKKIALGVKKDLGLNEGESMKLAQELVCSSAKVSKEVLGTVQKHVEKAVLNSKLVNKHELSLVKQRLKKKIKELRKEEPETMFNRLKRKMKY